MTGTTPSDATLQILGQLLTAFGQGAGTMIVSREAIATAIGDYMPRIARDAGRWAAIELQTLDLARALGRLSAHLAVHDGRDRILDEHYREAREKFHPLAPCPLCLDEVRRR